MVASISHLIEHHYEVSARFKPDDRRRTGHHRRLRLFDDRRASDRLPVQQRGPPIEAGFYIIPDLGKIHRSRNQPSPVARVRRTVEPQPGHDR